MTYLSVEGIWLLLAGPDQSTRHGHRDLGLLSLLNDSGAHVQEVIVCLPKGFRRG